MSDLTIGESGSGRSSLSGKTVMEIAGAKPTEYKPGLIFYAPEKPTNPKDAVGIKKVPLSCVSAPVLMEIGLGMLEGAAKYGRHNYRDVGVRASVYYDAALRHLMAWWEGEDLDPDSDAGLSHVSKCITSLVVLRDAMIQEKLTDDRPPKTKDKGWLQKLNEKAAKVIEQHKDKNPKHYTEIDNEKS